MHSIQQMGYGDSRDGIRIDSITLIGEAVDIAIAKEIFVWLQDLFPSLYKRAIKSGMLRDCAASRNGFWGGLWQGILEANKRQEASVKQAEAQTYALVLRSKEDAIEVSTALSISLTRRSRAMAML